MLEHVADERAVEAGRGRRSCSRRSTAASCSLTPKIRISISPIQKYGMTEVITKTGGMMLSSRPPRRQAPRMPMPGAEDEGQDRGDADQAERPRDRAAA